MTKKELSQLYYLNREIQRNKEKRDQLRCRATSMTSVLSGMPHAAGVSDKTALAAEIAYLDGIIDSQITQTFYEYNRLIAYINGIDDSLTRQVFELRFINRLGWQQIAFSIGGGNTASSVRHICERYLEKM